MISELQSLTEEMESHFLVLPEIVFLYEQSVTPTCRSVGRCDISGTCHMYVMLSWGLLMDWRWLAPLC